MEGDGGENMRHKERHDVTQYCFTSVHMFVKMASMDAAMSAAAHMSPTAMLLR